MPSTIVCTQGIEQFMMYRFKQLDHCLASSNMAHPESNQLLVLDTLVNEESDSKYESDDESVDAAS